MLAKAEPRLRYKIEFSNISAYQWHGKDQLDQDSQRIGTRYCSVYKRTNRDLVPQDSMIGQTEYYMDFMVATWLQNAKKMN